MKNLIKLGLAAIIAVMLLNVAACGKVSRPVPVEGSGYPHSYPRR